MKLGEIARSLDASLEGDSELEIDELAPLESAGPRSLSFLANPRYAPQLAETRAGAVILGPGVESPGCAVLRARAPYLAFARALALFAPPTPAPEGIHPAAHIAATARIGANARISPGVVIGEEVRIGSGVTLYPGVVIYPGVTIGDDFTAHANVVIRERVRIGHRVTFGSGVGVGGEGFGYLPLPGGGIVKLCQIGEVEIEDDVEVGPNSTIDRATIGVTRIARGAKLDNLVMIGHGCRVGEEALLAAQTGLAGSTVVGARAQLGGQVGCAGHLTVGAGARIAAKGGVANDVPEGAEMGGYPAMDAVLWRRVVAALHRLPELLRRVRRLEKSALAD